MTNVIIDNMLYFGVPLGLLGLAYISLKLMYKEDTPTNKSSTKGENR